KLSQQQEDADPLGQGRYGAPRGSREHKGLDIECSDGSIVYAPFDVTLHGNTVTPFTAPDKVVLNNGISLRGEGLCFKLFPVNPDRTSGSVRKGQRIGVMLPMQTVFPGIISHVHVQMCNRSDPTPYF
ncbi:leukocyte cell-derived chemotaxin-2-like, partial [Morone saxatilis]|uniref:leukocyte cell-derived chemotaxin-2-like n=1 Tax=Morone saxatilis TaxID=34816 RepID=UPI0015E1CF35